MFFTGITDARSLQCYCEQAISEYCSSFRSRRAVEISQQLLLVPDVIKITDRPAT